VTGKEGLYLNHQMAGAVCRGRR